MLVHQKTQNFYLRKFYASTNILPRILPPENFLMVCIDTCICTWDQISCIPNNMYMYIRVMYMYMGSDLLHVPNNMYTYL